MRGELKIDLLWYTKTIDTQIHLCTELLPLYFVQDMQFIFTKRRLNILCYDAQY